MATEARVAEKDAAALAEGLQVGATSPRSGGEQFNLDVEQVNLEECLSECKRQ